MIKGIGIDIIEIDRIKDAVEKYGDSFLKRIYTKRELKYCSTRKSYKYPELSVRFSAKEAYAKAIGKGMYRGIVWREIEIVNDKMGKPQIYLRGKLAKNVNVSLSHSRNSATAVVVIG